MGTDKYTFTIWVHRHKCICGCIWEHGDNCSGDSRAHTCPICGNMQWYQYLGSEPTTKVVKDEYTFHLRD